MSKEISFFKKNIMPNFPFIMWSTTISVATVAYCLRDKALEKYQHAKAMYLYLFRIHDASHVKTISHIIGVSHEICKVYLTQNIFHNSTRIRKNVYDIEYTIHCKRYRFHVQYKLGPSRFRQFIADENVDVSETLFPYVGPNDDFHGIRYTPKDFGYDRICVHYQGDETVRVFAADEDMTV